MVDPEILDEVLRGYLNRNESKRQKGELIYSTCPACGEGDDRFHANYDKETFWCRHCEYAGGVVDLIVKLSDGTMNRRDVEQMLGKTKDDNHKMYTYTDERGVRLFEVHVVRGPKGGKKVWQTLPGGKRDDIPSSSRVLYNLPQSIRSRQVFVVEGEKCCEAMRGLGLTATTNSMGAGKFRLSTEGSICAVFKDKDVVVIPDNDAPGKDHARDIVEAISGLVRTVRLIELPGLAEKGDVADFIIEHGPERAKQIIGDLINTTEPEGPPRYFRFLDEYLLENETPPTPIVEAGILDLNENLLISAEYGQMKSMMRMQLSLCIASGTKFLGARVDMARTVGVFQWENSDYLEKKRLKNMMGGLGVKMSLINRTLRYADRKERFNLTDRGDRIKLMERAKQIGTEVLLFDCLSNMHLSNENDNIQMRSVVDTLSDINAKVGTSCVLVHHMGKPSQDRTETRHRIRGAISLQDWPTSIMTIMPHSKGFRIIKKVEFPKVRDPDPSFDYNIFAEFDRTSWCFNTIDRTDLPGEEDI